MSQNYDELAGAIEQNYNELSGMIANAEDAGNRIASVRLCDSIGNPLRPLAYELDENGYEVPGTREEADVQKKAKQLSDIEWTPVASVPKNTGGTFPANVKVKGIPYTSVKECDKYVGWDVSIHTFMTAVNNPYSLLYTENVSAANSQSAWGKTYHGVNCSAYFGTVCNEYAKYSAGCDVDFETTFDKWLHEHRLTFAKVFDQSAQGVRIGDIWWQSGHNRIITGVKRTESGEVTDVVVSEAAGANVIVTEMTASAFNALIASTSAIIYRSIELYRNRYTPSPYIPLGDEDGTPVTYNDDICTFAGDRATFREGDTIVIDYNLKSVGAWTAMELYKNDVLVDTITIDTSAHDVNLTSRNLTYGKYKARMKNGSNYSGYTYWEILQTSVSHSFVNGKSSFTFSSNNGKPWYYILGIEAGNRTVMNSFTDAELENGAAVVDFVAMRKQQRYDDTDLSGTYYLKVKFRGEYGCVTNDPIPVVF